MSIVLSPRARSVILPALLALALGMSLPAQVDRAIDLPAPVEPEAQNFETGPLVPVLLEGYVFEPDKRPAVGAVVVSSAGGNAITDIEGWYQLEVEVPLEAESVEITAVGAGGSSRLATQNAGVLGAPRRTPVGPLFLSQGSTCSPSWLPTFGEQPGLQGYVSALTVYDDGSRPMLYAGGYFTTAGGAVANGIARWDGTSWSALGSGMNSGVGALTVYDDGGGPALCAGGNFTSAIDSADSYLALWGRDTTPPILSCPPVFAADAFNSPPGEVVPFSVTATDDHDPSPALVCVPPSGSFFPPGRTLVTCTATDACGNQSTCQFPVTVQIKARRQ